MNQGRKERAAPIGEDWQAKWKKKENQIRESSPGKKRSSLCSGEGTGAINLHVEVGPGKKM